MMEEQPPPREEKSPAAYLCPETPVAGQEGNSGGKNGAERNAAEEARRTKGSASRSEAAPPRRNGVQGAPEGTSKAGAAKRRRSASCRTPALGQGTRKGGKKRVRKLSGHSEPGGARRRGSSERPKRKKAKKTQPERLDHGRVARSAPGRGGLKRPPRAKNTDERGTQNIAAALPYERTELAPATAEVSTEATVPKREPTHGPLT